MQPEHSTMGPLESAVEATLRRAGRPLTRAEVRLALNIPADDAQVFHAMVGRLPFVEVDPRRWGLVDRDIPGGVAAYEAAIVAIGAARCTTPLAAQAAVARLSGAHATWTREIVASAYRTWKARRSIAFESETTGVRALVGDASRVVAQRRR